MNQTETLQRFMRSGEAAREAPASGGASPYRAGVNAGSGGEFRPSPSRCTTRAQQIRTPYLPGLKPRLSLRSTEHNPALTNLRGVLVLFSSDQGRALTFDHSPVDDDVRDVFSARHFIHDIEHDLFKH
jgi:hypothetical protein